MRCGWIVDTVEIYATASYKTHRAGPSEAEQNIYSRAAHTKALLCHDPQRQRAEQDCSNVPHKPATAV